MSIEPEYNFEYQRFKDYIDLDTDRYIINMPRGSGKTNLAMFEFMQKINKLYEVKRQEQHFDDDLFTMDDK